MIQSRKTPPGTTPHATVLVVIAAALMTVGVVMRASTAAELDQSLTGHFAWNGPVMRQLCFAIAGVCVMLIFSRIDPVLFRWRGIFLFQPAFWMLLVAIGLLVCVWVPGIGHESHGRHRWIHLGPVGFQPSELAKLTLVVGLAAFLARTRKRHANEPPDMLVPAIAIGLLCVLVGIEDFGTAALLALVGAGMLVAGGCSFKAMFAWVIPAVGAFVYLLLEHPYRVKRLLTFLNIWKDPKGDGYHAVQSLAAIASGGWAGRGLGAGISRFDYLPESAADFVFAVICEEAGFFGATVVIGLYIAFVYFGLRVVRSAVRNNDLFRGLIAFGMTTVIGFQALINIAVVTVVAPTKGIALPLVSAGGTGLLSFSVAVGLIAAVDRSTRRAQSRTVVEEVEEDERVPVVNVEPVT